MIELDSGTDSSDRLSDLVRDLRDMGLTGTELDEALRALSDPDRVRRLLDCDS